jgi:hypothetical protein
VDIDLDRVRSADSLKLALLKHAKESDLNVHRDERVMRVHDTGQVRDDCLEMSWMEAQSMPHELILSVRE